MQGKVIGYDLYVVFYRDLTEDHGRTHLVTLFDHDAFLSDMPTRRTPAALSNLVAT